MGREKEWRLLFGGVFQKRKKKDQDRSMVRGEYQKDPREWRWGFPLPGRTPSVAVRRAEWHWEDAEVSSEAGGHVLSEENV